MSSVKERGLSQEALKVIACMTMLLDHIGATMVRGYTLRIIGRIAFPIFCFLMAEGAHYTKNPKKYCLRLVIGMLLSELPFDLAFRLKPTWEYQSVMVTLLLGFVAVEVIQNTKYDIVKLLAVGGGFALAEWANTDYGGFGVLLVVLFSQTRGRLWLQTVLLAMFAWMTNSVRIPVWGFSVPIEMFAVLAMIPIALYSGRKATSSKAVQWGFYLFYPVHLTVLVFVRMLVLHQDLLNQLIKMLGL
ncbi:MAG: TraX family protein [Faecousia sp.]